MSIDKELKKIAYLDYNVQEISSGVYKVNEYNLTTMFVIVGENKAVTIDCGTGIGDYRRVISKITKLPVDLIVTHGHVDHIGGRGQFEKMYISEKDQVLIKDVNVFYRKMYVLLMKAMGFKVLKNKAMAFEKVFREPQVNYLKEGDIIDLGGKTITVLETPGHTIGSLSFLLNEDKILFTGDVINPLALMFLKNSASLEILKISCKRILDIEGYDTIWASHLSAPITKDDALRAVGCIEKAQKRRCKLPLISIAKKDEYTIIYFLNKSH